MRFTFRVVGRPAPEGSHEVGANGYVMHSSKYLANWRTEVNRACRKAYLATSLTGRDVPLFRYPEPVYVLTEHIVGDDQCRATGTDEPTGMPDVDKLGRATIDGLGEARVFGNDSQVTDQRSTKRRTRTGEQPGAYIIVSDEPIHWPSTAGEINNMETFTPSGRFRLVLEEVGTDQDGDRSWSTLIEATDNPERIASIWLPAMATALGGVPAAAVPVSNPTTAPASEPAAGRKPRGKRAEPAAPVAPESAELPEPVAQPAPEPATAQAPAEPPARVNPFAR